MNQLEETEITVNQLEETEQSDSFLPTTQSYAFKTVIYLWNWPNKWTLRFHEKQ